MIRYYYNNHEIVKVSASLSECGMYTCIDMRGEYVGMVAEQHLASTIDEALHIAIQMIDNRAEEQKNHVKSQYNNMKRAN